MQKFIKTVTLASAFLTIAGAAAAEFPEKPIKVIVGYSAGGGTDVMARTVAPFLEKYLGEGSSIVVKNMPGASGQIGVTEAANAEKDGYTLGTYNLPGMMARTLDRKADYDADSFTYLANVVNDPNVIVTSKKSGLDTFEKLLAEAKANPRAVTVGMSSLGGDDHFLLTKLQKMTDTEFTIVPFRGSAPARTALMGGHVAMGVLNVSEVSAFKEEINILGIALAERSEFAPDVPTFKEQGIDLINGSMRGFIAPAGLPDDVRAKLLDAFNKLEGDAEFKAAMKATANPVEVVTGDDFKALNAEILDLAKAVWAETPWR
ncbi:MULTISPECIES: Bug family tripartite tricarboxylate transporter substrate binding protein [Cohaesibacter]|uniref:Bug family tripartite tricarboxylate transporter substrate binding protein n=1 Tax=Cohaesibacter TaxID=655352 RepID=UPI000DEA6267|nr:MULTISPECIES: tripartite tricarboxylate transporter substrate binding protein [Cohaesibacter]TLP48288.1 tripartite tricarboxylate transporter substrate binding protein [Cohaesibacter sp. CAU 1516]